MATSAAYRNANATAPAHTAWTVTPSDVTIFPVTRALYIGAAGNLTVDMADDSGGSPITFVNVPVGIFPLQVIRVRSTGTTAASIVALY